MTMRIINYFLIIILLVGCKKEQNNRNFQKNNKTEVKVKAMQTEKTKKIVTQSSKKQTLLDYSFKAENVKTLQDSAAYLKHYYNQFAKTKDSLSEVLFFDMFPNNFKDFKNLYGYDDSYNDNIFRGSPLYSDYTHILDYNILNVSTRDYLYKIISIALNGRWQGDNVNFLQDKFWDFYKSDTELFFNALVEQCKSKKALSSFWIFYFDGPAPNHPSKVKMYEDILQKLETLDSTMIPIVKSAYAKVQEDWKVR